jgi:phosphoglycolate phosphatase
MALRAAIFDLDGTLIDSLADIAGSANHALAAAGLPTHAVEAYRAFIGHGLHELLRRAAPSGADVQALAAVWSVHYTSHCTALTRPFPGIEPSLEALRAAGLRFAVVSNKPDRFTQQIVAALFPADTFVFVAGERADLPRKPDPTATLAALKALGTSPEHTCFVGDSPVDISTARATGTVAVGVSWGFRARASIEEADLVFDHPDQLATLAHYRP